MADVGYSTHPLHIEPNLALIPCKDPHFSLQNRLVRKGDLHYYIVVYSQVYGRCGIFNSLPVQSLLRFRAASKFWRDVIDNPAFRKSHIANYRNDSEDYTSILLFNYFPNPIGIWKSSIIFRDTGKSFDFVNGLSQAAMDFRVVGPVAGLICIHSMKPNGDIAVCNPFLDELKILPVDSVCSQADSMNVGISYDSVGDNYKVLKLLSCITCRVHASIYSENTNSWLELALGGQYVSIIEPIQSTCSNNGAIAYWRAVQLGEEGLEYVILSFDMKTELFRGLEMKMMLDYGSCGKIYEKRGGFVLIRFKFNCMWLYVYEGRVESNNRVEWRYLKRVKTFGVFEGLLGRSGCVVFRSSKKLIFYDYCAEKFVWGMKLPIDCCGLKVLEYDGSFVSP